MDGSYVIVDEPGKREETGNHDEFFNTACQSG